MAELKPDLRELHEAVDLSQLGVFGPNKVAPLHRWVSFTEGFSAQLVAHELEHVGPEALVFDPFGGTGTTPLVAAQLGHQAAWAEVNPYLREAAVTKVAAARAPRGARRRAATALRKALLAGRGETDADNPLLRADAQRQFFPPGSAEHLVQWLARFEQVEDVLARSIGRLAAASAAISVSNMKRAVDLRRKTTAELRRGTASVDETVRARVALMIEDLDWVPQAGGSATLVSSDARTLPDELDQVALVVTSPPYLNGTNYCRNTKLELLLLGHIRDESELAVIRAAAVTAGINNVSRRMRAPEDVPQISSVAEALDERGYDRRIVQMVRGYFSDMKAVLAAILEKMAPSGRLVLDIGDSRFAGVHVDTPALLASVAEVVGWTLEREEVLRSRVAKDGNPLCQKLLYLYSR
jgi:hypothetical protein